MRLTANADSGSGRWTKRAILLSALAAVSFQAWYSAGHPYLARALLILPAAAYFAGRRAPAATAGVVMAFGYILPTLLIRTIGIQGAYQSVWAASLLAALAGTTRSGWQFPPRYRFALVAWGLVVAATWPLVALRELDWTPRVFLEAPPNRNPAMYAIDTALFVAGIAQTHLLGILWLDWLFGTFSRRTLATFERRIIGPLVAAASLAAVLAVYQGLFDLEYPRQGLWAYLGRASGALDDANASGALGALWVAIPIALAFGQTPVAAVPAWALSALMLAGIWHTGSRTATFGAAIALGGVLHTAFARSVHRSRLFVALAALAVVGAFVGLIFFRAPTSNPMSRMREFQQRFSTGGLIEVGRELWRRNGYGSAATRMIRDEPLQGIGVGDISGPVGGLRQACERPDAAGRQRPELVAARNRRARRDRRGWTPALELSDSRCACGASRAGVESRSRQGCEVHDRRRWRHLAGGHAESKPLRGDGHVDAVRVVAACHRPPRTSRSICSLADVRDCGASVGRGRRPDVRSGVA